MDRVALARLRQVISTFHIQLMFLGLIVVLLCRRLVLGTPWKGVRGFADGLGDLGKSVHCVLALLCVC